jgi:hypothetical protein
MLKARANLGGSARWRADLAAARSLPVATAIEVPPPRARERLADSCVAPTEPGPSDREQAQGQDVRAVTHQIAGVGLAAVSAAAVDARGTSAAVLIAGAWIGSLLPDADLAGARVDRRTRFERRRRSCGSSGCCCGSRSGCSRCCRTAGSRIPCSRARSPRC